jgi:hypothetical protein
MKFWLWLRLVLGASAVLAGRVPSEISQASREVMATEEARTSALDHSSVVHSSGSWQTMLLISTRAAK